MALSKPSRGYSIAAGNYSAKVIKSTIVNRPINGTAILIQCLYLIAVGFSQRNNSGKKNDFSRIKK
jgi:hypothetical protein